LLSIFLGKFYTFFFYLLPFLPSDTTSSVPYQQPQQHGPTSIDDQQTLQYCLYQVQKLHGGSPIITRELESVLPTIMKDCVVSNIEVSIHVYFEWKLTLFIYMYIYRLGRIGYSRIVNALNNVKRFWTISMLWPKYQLTLVIDSICCTSSMMSCTTRKFEIYIYYYRKLIFLYYFVVCLAEWIG
jgi:hypothetical protein